MLKIFMVIFAILCTNSPSAADFTFSNIGGNSYVIELHGTINEGDHNRLLLAIRNSPVEFSLTQSMRLSSKGGSVTAAIKISEIIEKTALMTVVEEDDVCASSCFLIYVAGYMRYADGDLLIHRPYIASESYDSSQMNETIKRHRALMRNVRQFLEARSVPPYLIDRMMNRPSTEAYRLSIDDYLELGSISPSFEEVSIAKCGMSSNDLLDKGISLEKRECVYGLRNHAKFKFMSELLDDNEYVEMAIKLKILELNQ